MFADFTIHIHEARKPLAVQVKVHESTAALRGAALRYARKHGYKDAADHKDTLGVCHRYHMFDDPVVALVRLAPPHIGAGIVAHEMTHAAVQVWEVHHEYKEVPITCENDEWFCWVLGELVRQTTIQLYEKGVYVHEQIDP